MLSFVFLICWHGSVYLNLRTLRLELSWFLDGGDGQQSGDQTRRAVCGRDRSPEGRESLRDLVPDQPRRERPCGRQLHGTKQTARRPTEKGQAGREQWDSREGRRESRDVAEAESSPELGEKPVWASNTYRRVKETKVCSVTTVTSNCSICWTLTV